MVVTLGKVAPKPRDKIESSDELEKGCEGGTNTMANEFSYTVIMGGGPSAYPPENLQAAQELSNRWLKLEQVKLKKEKKAADYRDIIVGPIQDELDSVWSALRQLQTKPRCFGTEPDVFDLCDECQFAGKCIKAVLAKIRADREAACSEPLPEPECLKSAEDFEACYEARKMDRLNYGHE